MLMQIKTGQLLRATENTGCLNCSANHTCLTKDMSTEEVSHFSKIIDYQKIIKKGHQLYHAGSKFDHIHIVKYGILKSSITNTNGQEHLVGFHTPGNCMGTDGISAKSHITDSKAIIDSVVCAIPFSKIIQLISCSNKLKNNFIIKLSDEISRANQNILMISKMNADERLIYFIKNILINQILGKKTQASITIPMTRNEIGQWIGVSQETISRSFASLTKLGFLEVNGKKLELTNISEFI